MTKRFYCHLCWQEFDDPKDHALGSWFNRERLDVPCPGDIRRADGRPVKPKFVKQAEALNLDAGESIKLTGGRP